MPNHPDDNMKKVVFIINPISGTTKKAGIPKLIESRLDKSLFDSSIAETQYAGHATEIAAKCAEEGVDIVVAVGGDGTVNEVGRALTGTSTVLSPCVTVMTPVVTPSFSFLNSVIKFCLM